MVIDAAKGIESQTRKLFEVCRLRDHADHHLRQQAGPRGARPVRAARRDRARRWQLDVAPVSWPIGMGRDFLGCYDLSHDRLDPDGPGRPRPAWPRASRSSGLDDPKLDEHLPARPARAAARGGRDGARAVPGVRRREPIAQGNMTPIFFGSALNNFGVQELLDGLAELAPPRRSRSAAEPRQVAPDGGEGHRLRLQDPGQHGSQAPRPHRLRALAPATSSAA